MTADELKSQILADSNATDLARRIANNSTALGCALTGNDLAAADALNLSPPLVSNGLRLTYLGLSDTTVGVGAAIARRLIVSVRAAAVDDPLIDEMQNFLRGTGGNSGIEVGNTEVAAMLTSLANAGTSGGLTADDVTAIAAKGQSPVLASHQDVSAAMLPYRPDGRIPA